MCSLDVVSSSVEEQAAKMAVSIMINYTFFIVLCFNWVSKMVAKVVIKNERHKFSDKKMLVNL